MGGVLGAATAAFAIAANKKALLRTAEPRILRFTFSFVFAFALGT